MAMKGNYGGPWSIKNFFQAVWQDQQFFERHNITHVTSVVIFFTACNAKGETVIIRDEHGKRVGGYDTAGGYRCAAREYDRCTLEPETFNHKAQ
jgi:hypothetical protein